MHQRPLGIIQAILLRQQVIAMRGATSATRQSINRLYRALNQIFASAQATV